MTGFDLPTNFNSNPESLLRRARPKKFRPRTASPQQHSPVVEPVISAPMAQKTLREFSAPSAANIRTGPEVNAGEAGFEIKTGIITMVQANPFCGKANEDASAHLQQFLELCGTFTVRGVTQDAIRLRLFPFSLLGRAKQWFYATPEAVNTWDKCSNAFLAKFFPMGKTNQLRGRISSFQQATDESTPEAWERFQEYILACPHHGMEEWLLIQNFYNGLTPKARDHLDAAAGGAFLSLTAAAATDLIEKMVSNQGWSNDRAQPKQRGMHAVKEVDMLQAKMDLLLKRLDERATEMSQAFNPVHAIDRCTACEVCGNPSHSGNDCPETREDVAYLNNNNNNSNNGYRPQGGQNWNQPRPFYQGNNSGNSNFNSNQPSLKDLVFGQMKITEAINKRLNASDKNIENMNIKMDGLTSAVKNQMSFNKMIET